MPPGTRAWDRGLAPVTGDGVRLRAALWEGGPRGLALVLPGRCAFLEQAALAATPLAEQGFSVAALDWRGQGLSARPLRDRMRGHVGDFRDYHLDIEALMAEPAVAALGPARLVFGHSMGGAIALDATVAGRLAPGALALSAPMCRIASDPVSAFAMRRGARVMRGVGFGTRWPPVPRPNASYVLRNGFRGNCLTGDEALYDWLSGALAAVPALRLGLPSWGWLAAAADLVDRLGAIEALDAPTLFLVGSREGVVDPEAIRTMAARLRAELVEIEGALHELAMETEAHRARLWSAVGAFADRVAP
ncbi:MAG: alpha/beta fold hydrolase [Paracoccaceae bacterium]